MAAVTFRAEARIPKSKTGNFACLIRSAKAAIVPADAWPSFGADKGLIASPVTGLSVTSCGIDKNVAPFFAVLAIR